jgi:hypothetical protein
MWPVKFIMLPEPQEFYRFCIYFIFARKFVTIGKEKGERLRILKRKIAEATASNSSNLLLISNLLQ